MNDHSPHTPATFLLTFSAITAISSRQPATNARSHLMYTVEFHFPAVKYKTALKTSTPKIVSDRSPTQSSPLNLSIFTSTR
ncbi:MAG TPA: hypothetical protein PLZ12_10925 [Saprospiraceae bacterium]|nr:hypothetical protein [Saprospiraceae bacterium]